jgi:hypothetical protein
MRIMPVELERACERRWTAKFRKPAPVAPLMETTRAGLPQPIRMHEDFWQNYFVEPDE